MKFLVVLALVLCSTAFAVEPTAFFEKSIRPILIDRCYECHSVESGKSKGGLRLDSRAAVLKGGDNGPALVAGDPDKSRLIEAVRYHNQDTQMPPKGALPASEVKLLEEWVKIGAPDPRSEVATKTSAPRIIDIAAGAQHWAFRPIQANAKLKSPTANPIDEFITAKLSANGLTLASPADARTLIRRITFDLTGLPPTPQELDDFLAASIRNPQSAIHNLIDRLLASPHYGEKWGRHWLDVARYADSNGLDENIALGTAWRYRDFVVQAFNTDMPFDQFLTEQLAGDLLESPDLATRHRRMSATAFLNLGAKVLAEPDKDKLTMDVIDEQIDVVGRAFMGLTLGCARCHDHKFDPIPQYDYYALAAIFKSTSTIGRDRIGALSTAYEAPLGDFEAFASIKSAERILNEQKTAVSKAQAAANALLTDEVRGDAVDYLIAATELPQAPTLSQAKPIADRHHLRAEVLLNCRVWLAANEEHPVFEPWHQAMREHRAVDDIRGHYLLLFAQAKKAAPVTKSKSSDGIIKQARAALDDAKGFLALPPEPIVLYAADVAKNVRRLQDLMLATENDLPDLPTTLAVHDAATILKELPVHIRGNHLALGKSVPRGFPQVIQASLKTTAKFQPDQSGRLELARWLASATHPLTSRVIVNRVWTWHFNQGLVQTVDNFGLLGQAPTHPELLDFLAHWFSSNGWSIKELHRLILTSQTYQQSSTILSAQSQIDPENKFLHHFPLRRLEAEEIRDAILHVAGSLDTTIGGKTIPRRNREFVFNHTSKDFTSYGSTRRAMYLPIIRNNLYDLFQQFDYPDPSTSTGLRNSTVVSPQALLLMNSGLAMDAATTFAQRLLRQPDFDARLRSACRLAFAREATESDLRRARDFLTTAEAALASTEPDPAQREHQSWNLLAQVLMMSSEFIYLR